MNANIEVLKNFKAKLEIELVKLTNKEQNSSENKDGPKCSPQSKFNNVNILKRPVISIVFKFFSLQYKSSL
jgi:hypothetical protein